MGTNSNFPQNKGYRETPNSKEIDDFKNSNFSTNISPWSFFRTPLTSHFKAAKIVSHKSVHNPVYKSQLNLVEKWILSDW